MRKPRRTMDHGAAPCRNCGTEGGVAREHCHRPWRGRGYCASCYDYRRVRGLFDGDAAHIYYPLPKYRNHEHLLWHTPSGKRQASALGFAAEYDPAEVIRDAETFAAKWLARNPAYLAKWHAEATAA